MKQTNTNNKTIRELDWNHIFSDQVHTIYEPLVNKTALAFKNVYDKYILNGNEHRITLIDENISKINNLNNEIYNEKKQRKITFRRVGNTFILIFSFLIIGLFFLGFYKTNKKIIKDFKNFKNERELVINKLIEDNKICLSHIFNKFSMQQWKNKILCELDIDAVNGIDKNDFIEYVNKEGFYGFNSIQKYKIRNSFYYDILYTKEYWKPVVTQGVGYISIQTKDGVKSEMVVAYHSEPTPFMYKKQSINIPTNYKPNLIFTNNSTRLTKKQYYKIIKKGEFLLENPDFYLYHNFDYNDKIAFIDYFKVKTQENFINYSLYFNNSTHFLEKTKNNLYVVRDYEDRNIAYSSTYSWLNSLIDLNKPITVIDTYQLIKPIIMNALKPVFRSITHAYLNTNIASEVFEKRGSYFSNYVYDRTDKNLSSNFTIYDIAAKALSNSYFYLTSYPTDKEVGMKITDYYANSEENIEFAAININMFSYWKEELIDPVYKSGIVIDVPYDKHHFFDENKKLLYVSRFKTIFKDLYVRFDVLSQKNWFSSVNMDIDNGIYNQDEFFRIIKRIQASNLIFKNCIFLVDNDGLFIFINEDIHIDKIQNLFEFFK